MEGKYNDPAARAAREEARRIVREFGDPNFGDHKDPYIDIALPNTEQVDNVKKGISQGVDYSVGDGITASNLAVVRADLQRLVNQNRGGKPQA
ncbi:MAG: hypothetical protein HYV38_03440 [Candidatus Levybacteria bacterium]|nr:hypothetical protein [Candidatus Levybacteria bacterium]MBI2421111.1 hypothetical protein [Candidatus Levybacteria bacterium]MBI4097589.1 hypothetical protein [Candidatus Levybacteria bacterium]